MSHPPVVIVDDQDREIGTAPLADVWRKGTYHRIVRIMVEDGQGRVLLQKRSGRMHLYPNRWDNSAAGHVDEGDTYRQAAARELTEELDISDVQLHEVLRYRTNNTFEGRILNRFNVLYRAIIDPAIPIYASPEEVESVQWFTAAEMKDMIAKHPEWVTDGIVDAIGHHYEPLICT